MTNPWQAQIDANQAAEKRLKRAEELFDKSGIRALLVRNIFSSLALQEEIIRNLQERLEKYEPTTIDDLYEEE